MDVSLDAKIGIAHYLTITNRYERKVRHSVLTSACRYVKKAELDLHSQRFVVNHSLSRQARHSSDIIAFFPDTHSSEYLTLLAFCAVHLECQ